MSDTCPHCGYCPTCKRANPTSAPQPYVVGYTCVTCGMWVAFGTFHQCNAWPWRVTWTSGGTNVLGTAK